MDIDKLIIGLGNPGTKYSQTRHNIGYMVADKLVRKYNGAYRKKVGNANYSIISIANKNILVVLPLTYMNFSGEASRYFLNTYKIRSSDMLIILDEYNFPLNKIHIKKVSSSGGHNGLDSIINETVAKDFYILRCGIDRNFGVNELVDYVLAPFDLDEQEQVKTMVTNSVLAIEFYIHNEIGKSLSYINSGKYLE